MNAPPGPLLLLLVSLVAVLALADWVATWRGAGSLRRITKPGTLLALVAVAVVLDPVDPTVRVLFVIGLVLSLAGDVFLMLDQRWFVAGLSSFLLAHLAYTWGLFLAPTNWWWAAAGLVVVVAAGSVVGRRIVGAVATGETADLTKPVLAYIVVISMMVLAAFGTGSGWAIGGALLFYASDSVLAWDRFVHPLRLGPLVVMVTYHLAQAGLVAWLVA